MKRLIAKYPEGYEGYEKTILPGVVVVADVGTKTVSKEADVE